MSDQFTFAANAGPTLIKPNTVIFDPEFYLITENKTRKHRSHHPTERRSMQSGQASCACSCPPTCLGPRLLMTPIHIDKMHAYNVLRMVAAVSAFTNVRRGGLKNQD
jgi:hypothetical protein